ncbi:hypothetical protein R8Z50_27210 [Longispora sp. K20-0274]|uniref:hypothetical protein n=1 Tax=Longispora sp. K20-0274 TaxID=3088255 RepID=UPI00399BAB3C
MTEYLTTTPLGAVETAYDDHLRLHRITSLRLECSGNHVYWLEPDTTYQLNHDGYDWTIRGGQWTRARLTFLGSPIWALPTPEGDEQLDQRHTYLLRPAGTGWELWLQQ